MVQPCPGPIVLFGSGETAPGSQTIYDYVMRLIAPPVRISILETPAGFELNSARVAGRIADYLREHLPNWKPEIAVIPARKRGTPCSPDDPAIIEPLWRSNVIFAGPGSPTYAVRQLRDSLAWHIALARHRLGAALILASAAVIAASAHTIPVYEIHKVGMDLHWQPGLDLLGAYGLRAALVSHWDNQEGGAELDTSRCWMGRSRFEALRAMLSPETPILGIGEHTALIVNCAHSTCQVLGRSGVTILRGDSEQYLPTGSETPLDALFDWQPIEPANGLPAEVWRRALEIAQEQPSRPTAPPEALALAEARQAARARRDWAAADALRAQIEASGWQGQDKPDGPQLIPRS